jgi:O-succinylbenzoate synthase
MVIKTAAELEQMGPVRFAKAEAVRVSVPMHEPFRISSGEVASKDAILLRVTDGEHFGWGESSAMAGAFYSSDTPDRCEQQIIRLLPKIIGMSFATMAELEAYLSGQSLSPFVRVAVENAAWEMLARARGISLWELFGLAQVDAPTGLAVGLYATLEDLKSALERYRPQDYKRLKIKIKRGQDVDLVRAVRQWYGDIPLFVDANADYGEADIPIFQELDQYGLMMLEQPFAKSDDVTSAKLQQIVKTPICFDEGIETAEDVFRGAKADAVRIVNIKLQRVGGFLEAFRIIEACVVCRVPFWMGTMPELGIGSAQALVLTSHPACKFPTDVEPSSRWYAGDILSPELQMEDALLRIPPGPGLGFAVDEALVDRFATKRWSF